MYMHDTDKYGTHYLFAFLPIALVRLYRLLLKLPVTLVNSDREIYSY